MWSERQEYSHSIKSFSLNTLTSIFFIVFVDSALSAQEKQKVSLHNALEIAKENNLLVKKGKLLQAVAEEEIIEKEELRLPEVDFHSLYSRITNLTEFKGGFLKDKAVTRTIPEIYDISSSFRMPVYSGNKINNLIKKAEQEHEISTIFLEKAENDVQLQVVASYLGIYKMMELQKIINESIEEERERLKEVSSYKKHGTVTKDEVLRAELQLSERQLDSMNNEKNIDIVLHDLKTILQFPETTEFSIDTTDLLEQEAFLDLEYYHKLALKNEEVRIADQEVEIKKTEVQLAKAGFYPNISFFGNYNLRYPNYMFFPPDPYLYSLGQVGFEATFNISGLYKNKSQVQLAKAKMEAQENERNMVKDEMSDKVFKQYTEYKEITDKFKVTDKAVLLATENYRIVKLKYLNQLALVTEMVDADNSLIQAKFNQIATRIDAVMKHYEILHTAGQLTK